jgi:hypothetical protein
MPNPRDNDDERLARIEKILQDINDRTRRLEEFTDAARRRAFEADRIAAETAAREAARLARRAKRNTRRKR